MRTFPRWHVEKIEKAEKTVLKGRPSTFHYVANFTVFFDIRLLYSHRPTRSPSAVASRIRATQVQSPIT